MVIIALANISLPLTNAFVGEFMMFTGIFGSTVTKYNIVFAVLAGLSVILGAVYTLNMIQKVFYGNTNTLTATARDIFINEKLVLGMIVIMILVLGVYPQPLLNVTNSFVDSILKEANITGLIK